MVQQNPALVINWALCSLQELIPQMCSWGAWDPQIPSRAGFGRSELIYWIPSSINIWVSCHVLGMRDALCATILLLGLSPSCWILGFWPYSRMRPMWTGILGKICQVNSQEWCFELILFKKTTTKKEKCWQLFNVNGFITLQRLTWKTATFL